MRRALVVAGSAIALLVSASPASAGGWWTFIELESSALASGTHMRASTEVMFESLEAADRARRTGSFAAYLVRGLDWNIVDEAMGKANPGDWWRLGDARAIRLGPVRLSDWDANLARASARFEVPDVPVGRYSFMFCTADCSDALADVVPSKVEIVTDPATSEVVALAERLRSRLYGLGVDLRHAEGQLGTVDALAREVKELRVDLGDVREQIAAASQAQQQDRPTPWAAFAGWFLAGALTVAAGFAVARRRRKDGGVAVVPQSIPDDARELVGPHR